MDEQNLWEEVKRRKIRYVIYYILFLVSVVLFCVGWYYYLELVENDSGAFGDYFESEAISFKESLCPNITNNTPWDLIFVIEHLDSHRDSHYRKRVLKQFLKDLIKQLPEPSESGLNIGIVQYADNYNIVLDIRRKESHNRLDILRTIRSKLNGLPGARGIGPGLEGAWRMLKGHRLEVSNKVIMIIGEGNPTWPMNYTSPITGQIITNPPEKTARLKSGKLSMKDRVKQMEWLGAEIYLINFGRLMNPDDDTLEILLGDQSRWNSRLASFRLAIEAHYEPNHHEEILLQSTKLVCNAALQGDKKRRYNLPECINEEARKWYNF